MILQKDINESILESLDGSQAELLPYLPYILQDLWEIGADPAIMLALIKGHIGGKKLKILDLGCGKGAVSVNIAKEIDCTVTGIDGMPDFIRSARDYAVRFEVQDKCKFEVGDIRIKIDELSGFDVIILGAIGPVYGDLQTTLKTLVRLLNEPGYVLLDDGYIDDGSKTDYDRCLRKTGFYGQITSAGFEIVQEVIFGNDTIVENDNFIYDSIERRINELKRRYPRKTALFDAYLKSQQFENDMLANEIITGTWLLKNKNDQFGPP